LALVGLGLGGIGVYNYYVKDGDNRRYKLEYTGKYICQVRGKIWKLSTGCVSESGDFATLFFLVYQHWGGCCYCHFAANFKAF